MKLRPAVQKFAEAMEQKLRINDHKTADFEGGEAEVMMRIVEELGEFYRACIEYKSGDWLLSEAADVANFLCMMVAYWNSEAIPGINEKEEENEE